MKSNSDKNRFIKEALDKPWVSVVLVVVLSVIGIGSGLLENDLNGSSSSDQVVTKSTKETLSTALPSPSAKSFSQRKYEGSGMSISNGSGLTNLDSLSQNSVNTLSTTVTPQTESSSYDKARKMQAASSNAAYTDAELEKLNRQVNGRMPGDPYRYASKGSIVRASQEQAGRQMMANHQNIRSIGKPAALSPEELARRQEMANDFKRAQAMEDQAERLLSDVHSGKYNRQAAPADYNPYPTTQANSNPQIRDKVQTETNIPITTVQQQKYADGLYTAATQEKSTNGFFGFKGQKKVPTTIQANPMPNTITAVVHGDADAITITNGTTVRLRLLEDVMVGGYILPKNSIISGVCQVSGERVNITVNAVRIDNTILPIILRAYDVDGIAGLYVPNLAMKNQIAEVGSQAVNGGGFQMPYMIPNGGNVGQMMVGQAAAQGISSVMNGARALASNRISRVKVTIRPNYRVFLRAQQQNNSSN
ncbi:conjugative transposon protein TraM [Siphonobacter sp. SORGH_AS_1065]|uniref:conjugative transposon protein TraM n=1 Tax=Siphonobacter sp. SORGH_AS_1065 TaxID=3041795 RepID=UPI002780A02C|nr:conjugative transposon protein TraM [Siphonobacter sp. SORGH_AS_1065]MDQ1090469.1 conjugative transposon TraM protein [Siphonobacter sp. SORGH_AS_1065]